MSAKNPHPTAVDNANTLTQGLRSGRITSFIAVAVGPGNHERYFSGTTGTEESMRLIGMLEVAKSDLVEEYREGGAEIDRGPSLVDREPE